MFRHGLHACSLRLKRGKRSTLRSSATAFPLTAFPRLAIPMTTFLFYTGAAFAEIAGCFAFWTWLRSGGSVFWIVPGALSLLAFALLLTRIDSDSAGRAFAAYGGIYITASLIWMKTVEGRSPDRWDILGAAICLVGAAVILWAPRST